MLRDKLMHHDPVDGFRWMRLSKSRNRARLLLAPPEFTANFAGLSI